MHGWGAGDGAGNGRGEGGGRGGGDRDGNWHFDDTGHFLGDHLGHGWVTTRVTWRVTSTVCRTGVGDGTSTAGEQETPVNTSKTATAAQFVEFQGMDEFDHDDISLFYF